MNEAEYENLIALLAEVEVSASRLNRCRALAASDLGTGARVSVASLRPLKDLSFAAVEELVLKIAAENKHWRTVYVGTLSRAY